jgi:subtilisin family serine protease
MGIIKGNFMVTKRFIKNLILIFILFCLCNSIYAFNKDDKFVKGELIIKFKTDTSAQKSVTALSPGKNTGDTVFARVTKKHNIKSMDEVFKKRKNDVQSLSSSKFSNKFLDNTYVLKFDTNTDVESLVKEYKDDPNVEYVEPNYIIRAFDTTPNDTYFNNQWALNNTGQAGGTSGCDIDAKKAWDLTHGSTDVIIAIIDTGVDYNHTDLSASIWINTGEISGNGIDDDGNGFIDDVRGWNFFSDPQNNNVMDDNGHGTEVAGIACGIGNNSAGITGTSWNSKIMCVKMLGSAGEAGTSLGAASSINYAANNGAKVINCSWGSLFVSGILYTAVQNATLVKGAVVVGSAGNDAVEESVWPAMYDEVIGVASTNSSDIKSSFSNYATWVDVSAPGSYIYSTLPGNFYGYDNGTSMAAPYVSGVAALLLAHEPGLTNTQVKTYIENYSENIDALNPTYAGKLGKGRLNAYYALMHTSTATYSISGYVKTTDSITLQNIRLDLSGDVSSTTYTNSSGYYSFAGLSSGNYMIKITTTPIYLFSPSTITYTGLSANQTNQNFYGTNIGTYTISGYVRAVDSSPIQNISLSLTGKSTGTVLSGVDGSYSFPSLAYGNYVVTISTSVKYTFAPASRSYTNLTIDTSSQNFTGTLIKYSVSGYVRTTDSFTLQNMKLDLTGDASSTTYTNSSGYYAFTNLDSGNYMIKITTTPIYIFSPSTRTYTVLASTYTNQNFYGTNIGTYSISGFVKKSIDNSPIQNIGLHLTGMSTGTVLSGVDGSYSFTNLAYGNYTVTIDTNAFYTFSPLNRSYTNLTVDASSQNFSGNLITYAISGLVIRADALPLDNIKLDLTGDTTTTIYSNSSGYYAFTGLLPGGNYAIKVSTTPEYIFAPSSRTYTGLLGNCTGQIFIGTNVGTYSISGYVRTKNSTIIEGITLYLTGHSTGTVASDSNGYYSFAGLVFGNYDVDIDTTTKYTFTPTQRLYTALDQNYTGQNYEGVVLPDYDIYLSKSILNFGDIEKLNDQILDFTITNNGKILLEGKISGDKDWILVQPATFKSNEQLVEVRLDRNKLYEQKYNKGKVNIITNGGDYSVEVKIAYMKDVFTRPNPFNPIKDESLFFSGLEILPNDTEITIFTLSGERVKTLQEEKGLTDMEWDARNEDGKKITSGIYIYSCKNSKKRVSGKFTVIKK